MEKLKPRGFAKSCTGSVYQFISLFFLVMCFTCKTVLICQCKLQISLQKVLGLFEVI